MCRCHLNFRSVHLQLQCGAIFDAAKRWGEQLCRVLAAGRLLHFDQLLGSTAHQRQLQPNCLLRSGHIVCNVK